MGAATGPGVMLRRRGRSARLLRQALVRVTATEEKWLPSMLHPWFPKIAWRKVMVKRWKAPVQMTTGDSAVGSGMMRLLHLVIVHAAAAEELELW